ncbi:hypothetical protein [Pseudoalteromonas sp. Of7M-16]|uniref:hypothetical protein n=1 Tax=Pseudoalteromonas sp. Of7M-16 TaxID=2917756 RepID=UPI001EF71233|nr:hypothetical protein [Pseudoalteromonas sp. Of7M-16]MCG7550398.1 hypothetical protein [Pseudoalteromonas sp. Of7M-16]
MYAKQKENPKESANSSAVHEQEIEAPHATYWHERLVRDDGYYYTQNNSVADTTEEWTRIRDIFKGQRGSITENMKAKLGTYWVIDDGELEYQADTTHGSDHIEDRKLLRETHLGALDFQLTLRQEGETLSLENILVNPVIFDNGWGENLTRIDPTGQELLNAVMSTKDDFSKAQLMETEEEGGIRTSHNHNKVRIGHIVHGRVDQASKDILDPINSIAKWGQFLTQSTVTAVEATVEDETTVMIKKLRVIANLQNYPDLNRGPVRLGIGTIQAPKVVTVEYQGLTWSIEGELEFDELYIDAYANN